MRIKNKKYHLSVVLFLVLIVNSTSGQSAMQKSDAQRIAVIDGLSVSEPNDEYPVSMGITSYPKTVLPNREIELLVKVKIHQGWHIYAYVPSSMFMETETHLTVPEGIQKIGELSLPEMETYIDNPDIMLYKGELHFYQKLRIDSSFSGQATITFSIDFSACNTYMCKPPQTIEKSVKITI